MGMVRRIALLGMVVGLTALVLGRGPSAPQSAEAAAQISGLTFSSDMTSDLQPAGQVGVQFSGDNNGVAVTFTFTDLPPGSGLSRIVRLNGEDHNWDARHGALNCCQSGGSGRYGFWVVKKDSGDRGDLPGGAYDVRLYLNGVEIQHAGFGITGTGGSDDDNQNSNDND
jgi:hypothetical protein